MNSKLESALSATLTIAAVAVAGAAVYGQLAPLRSPVVQRQQPVRTDDWRALLDGGVRIGARDAALQVIEFGDFQCPFCAAFHSALTQVMAEYPGDISLVFYNLPLRNIHPAAEEAAKAALCAGNVGRFREMAGMLFEGQDLLGDRSWVSYAASAGVEDIDTFSSCIDDRRTAERIETDKARADAAGFRITPTLIFNGWRWTGALPADSIRRMVRDALAGNDLYRED